MLKDLNSVYRVQRFERKEGIKEMCYSKLKGRIIEKYKTQEQFANHLSISNQTMSRKMTGKSSFSQDDIIRWCKALDIDLRDAGLYFICKQS